MIGELYVAMDSLDEAQKFFNQALSVSKKIDAPVELGSTYYNLGLLSKKRGQKNNAREFFRQAQEIYWVIDKGLYEEVKKEISGLQQ